MPMTILVVDTDIGKFGLDTLQKPVERYRICNVEARVWVASTTNQETTNTPLAVNDDGTRVSWARECSGLVVVLHDCPLHGCPMRTILEILACEGVGAGSAANCHPIEAILDHRDTSFVVCVKHLWGAQFVFLNDAPKWQEAVRWVLKGGGGYTAVEVHPSGKFSSWNLHT